MTTNRVVAFALLLAACAACSSSSTPSSPSPSTVTPPPPTSTTWKVTQSFVSVVGPDNCWVREQRQRWTSAVFPDLPMTIDRSGTSITLQSSFFAVNYAGTMSGANFTASGTQPLEGGGRPCSDGTSFQQQPGASTLTGSFSSDDRTMTATEVNSYRLTTGEPVTYTWAWQATR